MAGEFVGSVRVISKEGTQRHFGTEVESTGSNSVSTYELSSGRDSLVTSILSAGV